MRATFFLAATITWGALAFAACAHGETIGAASGGAELTGGAGGQSTTTTTTATSSSSSGSEHCGNLVGPDVMACCTACMKDGKPCQANGCYGGYWCKPATCGCAPPPMTCP
jgi:hypothetical protein